MVVMGVDLASTEARWRPALPWCGNAHRARPAWRYCGYCDQTANSLPLGSVK
jgi:hypothetical protein